MGWGSLIATCGLLLAASLSGCCLEVISGNTLASSAGSTGSTTGSTTGSKDAGPTTMLWVDGVGAVDPKGLPASGSVRYEETCIYPATFPGAGFGGPSAIDGAGDLWVFEIPEALLEWTPEDLAASCASSAPSITDLEELLAIAFDSDGNLWGSVNEDPEIIVGYRGADLMAAGRPVPAWTLTGNCGSLDSICRPTGLAFDAEGYLWVGDGFSLEAFSPSTRTGPNDGGLDGTGPLADFHVTSSCGGSELDAGGCLDGATGPQSLAFDAAGNLWVWNFGELIAYSRAQLQSAKNGEHPLPFDFLLVFQKPLPAYLMNPSLAFDADGNLWLGTQGNLIRVSRDSLDAGAQPIPLAPDIVLTIPTSEGFSSLAFSPIPQGLPIQP